MTDAAPSDAAGMVTLATADASLYLPLADLVDVEQELARIAKEKEKAEEGLRRIEAKLSPMKTLCPKPRPMWWRVSASKRKNTVR